MALFGGAEFPNGEMMYDHMDGIMDFQKMYMEEMANIRHENMFTFPVSSISMIRKNGKFVDEEFAEWAIRHNMKWCDSNFFIDDNVSSLSNCCRLKSDIRDLGYFNSIGGTALKVGSVKVNTINLARLALDTNTKEEYLEKELETYNSIINLATSKKVEIIYLDDLNLDNTQIDFYGITLDLYDIKTIIEQCKELL